MIPMLSSLSREVRAVQNPALGATLLWRCSVGYQKNAASAPVPIPFLFLVLPMLLHKSTATLVNETQQRSGLRKFTEKFYVSSRSETDVLLGLAKRAKLMRGLTEESLQIALAKKLMSLDVEAAAAFALSTSDPVAGIPPSVRSLMRNAGKIGYWFAEVSLFEASLLLKVRF